MKHDPKAFETLPHSVIDIAETLGLRVALTLMQHFGGRDFKFPTAPSSDHPVILALGETDGYALCHYMSGNQMYVPRGRGDRSVRGEVKRLEARGLDRTAIATALGVSERHVRRVANSVPDTRQGDLFSE